MASLITNEGASKLLGAATAIDWAADTIKARLVASSYTPNKDDVVMTGVTAIGTDQTLSNKTRTSDTTNDRIVYTNTANLTWTAVAGGSTIGHICIYKFIANDASSIPICYINVPPTATNGSNIVYAPQANGLFYLGSQVWQPPMGILKPGFGTDEVAGAPTSYVDNTHPNAIDAGNPWGTANVPRLTVPTAILPAGTVVQVSGGPYAAISLTWTSGGTLSQPVFIKGVGNPVFAGVEGNFIRMAGNYFIIEGVLIFGTQLLISGIANTIRHSEVTFCEGSSVVAETGSAGTVIFDCHIHDNGDSENPVEHDVHGVLVQEGTAYTWLLDSHVHHNGGDAIQVGQAGSAEPWARWVWIGGNTMHQDRENAVDIKRARDVIVASNTAYGYVPRSSSLGEVIVIHNGAERVFVINNLVAAGNYGVACTEGIAVFVVGNIFTLIKGSDFSSLFGSAAISLRNSHTVYASQNTIYDCDSAVSIPILTTGSPSEVNSNIINTVTNGIRYGTQADFDLAVISNNLLPPTDPLFVSVSDWRLQAGSPAKLAGLRTDAHAAFTVLYSLTVDKDFYGQPWGSPPPSIGAVE